MRQAAPTCGQPCSKRGKIVFQINEIVDNTYQILQEIGRGGTGIVFLAYHIRLEKYVVIKKIKDNIVDIVNVRSEVDILKKLHHKYLPQVYDFVQRDSEVYTVIDYIEGYDLEYYMSIGYQFSEAEILKWMKQMCEVLEYLHSQKPIILHSDIKPSNIMIDQDGNVCLIDFNISLDNQVHSGISGLSQYFASPEQVEKAVAFMGKNNPNNVYCNYYIDLLMDGRTDIYSMGATFYYIVTGIKPTIRMEEFQNYIIYGYSAGWDFIDTFPMGVDEKAQCLSAPYGYGLLSVIDKAMELNINKRYSDVSQMLKDLNTLRKRETGYKITQLIRYGSILVFAVLISVGILLCINGINKVKLDKFDQDVQLFYQIYNEGNDSKAISKGIEILNDNTYLSILDSNKESKAKILHSIGDCYYYNEEYKNAIPYYEEAYQYMKSAKEDSYYRDYAIALVKADRINIAYAQAIIEENLDSNSVGIKIIKAQISFEEGDYTSASEIADEVIQNALSTVSDKFKAYILKSEVADKCNDLLLSIKMREEAYKLDRNNKNNARKLAGKYAEYVEQFGFADNQFKKSYYHKAQNIYEDLISVTYSTIEDKINLAKVYTLINEKEVLKKAERLMLESLETNPNDYRIDLQLAYIYKGLGDNARSGNYCQKALDKYNEVLDINNEDYEQIYYLKNEIGA